MSSLSNNLQPPELQVSKHPNHSPTEPLGILISKIDINFGCRLAKGSADDSKVEEKPEEETKEEKKVI